MVKIETPILVGENENGSTFSFSGVNFTGGLIVFRKKGSISGRHYHNGLTESKNPEKMLLIEGELQLNLIDIDSLESQTLRVKAPAFIYISRRIWHEVIALSDIAFVEFNSVEEHRMDVHYDFNQIGQ